jgi:hypothetical protein
MRVLSAEDTARNIRHPLHRKVGNLMCQWCDPSRLVLDPACSAHGHNAPIFLVPEKSRAAEICNVDALLLCGDYVRLIIEVEETDIKPTNICGKFLTSALGMCYIHRTHGIRQYHLRDATFVQILSSAGLHGARSKKRRQAQLIAKAITDLCNHGVLPITQYAQFWDLHSTADVERLKAVVDDVQQGSVRRQTP